MSCHDHEALIGNIQSPAPFTKIYKDECCLCFKNQVSIFLYKV